MTFSCYHAFNLFLDVQLGGHAMISCDLNLVNKKVCHITKKNHKQTNKKTGHQERHTAHGSHKLSSTFNARLPASEIF